MKANTSTDVGCWMLHNGTVCDSHDCGRRDVLIIAGRIIQFNAKMEIPADFPCVTADITDQVVVPGFIDLHVHVLGGGGEDGPTSRVPEIAFSSLTTAGITTIVGVLGTDSITRTPEALLAKVKALRSDGLSAYMYTGAYHLPSPTITGSVMRDIALINEIIGVKTAISDHRSSQPTIPELARLASEARIGGMLGNNPGLVHTHVGAGKAGLAPIFEVCERTEIPISQFLPTHVARTPALLDQGIEFVRRGGAIDITAPSDPTTAVTIIKKLLASGVDLNKITFSSDGNGSKPRFDAQGRLIGMGTGAVSTLLAVVRELVRSKTLALPQAISLVTANPAARLGLSERKGYITPGADADILVLNQDLSIDKVFARGRLVVDDGKPVVKGAFE